MLLSGQQGMTIRLADIDAPESGQPFSRKARDLLAALTHDVDVLAVVKTKTDMAD